MVYCDILLDPCIIGFCHREERKRRGDLVKCQQVTRLLHFVRNDNAGIMQRSHYVTDFFNSLAKFMKLEWLW
jgi:hypothetical protein